MCGRILLVIILFAVNAFRSAAQNDSGLWPGKESFVYKVGLLKKDSVSIVTDVYDRFGKEMLVGEFLLQHLNTDSLLMNQLHNEGGAFLLQYKGTALLLTYLDMMEENGKYEYPQQFSQTVIDTKNGKFQMTERYVPAAAIVAYLKKNFKKLGELY